MHLTMKPKSMSSSGTKEKRVMYSKIDSSFVMIGNDTQII